MHRIILSLGVILLGALPAFAVDAAPGAKPVGIMDFFADTAIWTVVVFLGLFFILRKAAWGPILEGLHKREEAIHHAVAEAKELRAENARAQAFLKGELDKAHAEIPAMMEEARKDAAALKEEMRSEANAEIQKERARLMRELDTAKDQALQEIWTSAANLATLISTKAVGRALSVDDHRRLVDEALAEVQQGAN